MGICGNRNFFFTPDLRNSSLSRPRDLALSYVRQGPVSQKAEPWAVIDCPPETGHPAAASCCASVFGSFEYYRCSFEGT